MAADAKPAFKVIVVGGGPSGITAAHILHRAGIDFVVLERRTDVANEVGASLVLSPASMRVFHQLGLYDKLMDIGALVRDCKGFTRDGKVFKDVNSMEMLRKNHGMLPVAFHRAHLIQALFDGLPEAAKARYHTGKKLDRIVATDTGVTVTCADGTSYSGSVVIGADGVHSATRREMRRLALAEDPSREATWDAEMPYKAAYRCMWASFPRPTEAGQNYETQARDRSVMYITGKERGWIFLYEKLDEPPTAERISFTEDELEAYAARFADWPVTEQLKVKDVYRERFSSGGAGLEEGICKNWNWGGRVVLVGDAAHKFTPNAGLGFNNGVQDLVGLCNGLRRFAAESSASPSGGSPDFPKLQAFFEELQRERLELLQKDMEQSANVTRMHAWASTFHWIMARYILSWTFAQQLLLHVVVSPVIQQARVLDFISVSEPFAEGSYKWLHPLLKSA